MSYIVNHVCKCPVHIDDSPIRDCRENTTSIRSCREREQGRKRERVGEREGAREEEGEGRGEREGAREEEREGGREDVKEEGHMNIPRAIYRKLILHSPFPFWLASHAFPTTLSCS